MNEIDFKNWLSNNRVSKKVQSDLVSGLKRIEREIKNCDIDEQYRIDKCEYLMALFSNMGSNAVMQKLSGSFPVGQYEYIPRRNKVPCKILQ